MQKQLLSLFILCTLFFSACDDNQQCFPVTTDSNANKAQFLGTWYEIASLSQFFNVGCQCTQAEYIDNGSNIIVRNSCRIGGSFIGLPNRIEGTATVPDPNDFSKIKVKFPVAPVAADYWILDFDPNGQYMMVGDPDLGSLFVLSRARTLPINTYLTLTNKARAMCFDVDDLNFIEQGNCQNF